MYYLTANFTLWYCFFIAADETEALVPCSNRLINTYSAPSQYVWHTPHPLLCFPFMKSKRVSYFSSYSCHWQTKYIHVPVLFSMQQGILVFLFTEILLQVCCVLYLLLRWWHTLLYASEKLQENNSSTFQCRMTNKHWRNYTVPYEQLNLQIQTEIHVSSKNSKYCCCS